MYLSILDVLSLKSRHLGIEKIFLEIAQFVKKGKFMRLEDKFHFMMVCPEYLNLRY